MQAGGAARDGARVTGADARGKRDLELLEQRSKREPAGAQYRQHTLLLCRSDQRPGERDLFGAHERCGAAAFSRLRCIPYSSESTSASHEDSMMFSETPIEPHTSSPSEASSSTRVTAPVPFVS